VAHYVQRVRLRQPRIGTRKLHYLLNSQSNDGLKVGRDRLFEILAEHRLLVLPKRAYHKTTHSFHRFYRHPNLLKPGPDGWQQHRLTQAPLKTLRKTEALGASLDNIV